MIHSIDVLSVLFNSHLFLFGFLPLALLAVFTSGRSGLRGALAALTVLSIGFYAWWGWHNLFLLVAGELYLRSPAHP